MTCSARQRRQCHLVSAQVADGACPACCIFSDICVSAFRSASRAIAGCVRQMDSTIKVRKQKIDVLFITLCF